MDLFSSRVLKSSVTPPRVSSTWVTWIPVNLDPFVLKKRQGSSNRWLHSEISDMPSSERLPPVSGSVSEAILRLYRMQYGSGRCSNSLSTFSPFGGRTKTVLRRGSSLCRNACDMCLLHIVYPCDAIMAIARRMEDFRTVGASLTTRGLSGSTCPSN